MKKIYIMYCNPKGEDSFSYQIAKTYLNAASSAGNEVRLANVYDFGIDFLTYTKDDDLNKQTPEDREKLLTPELKEAQDNLVWANELVFIYPVWLGGLPAKLKAFIERVFQVGVVFDIAADKPAPVPLFTDKTAVVVQSYFMPEFAMKIFAKDISFNSLSIGILKTCGVKVRKRFDFSLAFAKPESFKKFLGKIEKFARKK